MQNFVKGQPNNININIEATYNLNSIVIHQGETRKNGHYISVVCHSNSWFMLNDEKVSVVQQSDALEMGSNNGYLLFYRINSFGWQKVQNKQQKKKLQKKANNVSGKIWPLPIGGSESNEQFVAQKKHNNSSKR